LRGACVVRRLSFAAVALGLAGLGLGCRKSVPPVQPEPAAKPSIRSLYALDPATLGAVIGVVKFVGNAPASVRIDTSADPRCGVVGVFSEQYAVHDGHLANVYVYVKSGPAAAMALGSSWNAPVVLDEAGCSFQPHVVAVMVGQRVEFRNDDSVVHAVHATPGTTGNAAVDISLSPRDVPQVRMFRKPEVMMPVRCDKHPWMNAYINISPTPFFAVTGADGKFELKGLPAGEYTLGFVQEKMGERTVTVTVKPQATTPTDMTYSL
jgi:plastocyanin